MPINISESHKFTPKIWYYLSFKTYLFYNNPFDNDNLEFSETYLQIVLPLNVMHIGYLNEWLNFELKIGDKTCKFEVLYWFASQYQSEFETFSNNFKMTVNILTQEKFIRVPL